jgi:hypothetical protein
MVLRSILLLLLGTGLGCGDDDAPGSGAYLSPCATSSDCPAALACHCGTCTRECAADLECADLRATSTCVPSASFTCGGSAPPSVCAVECADDSECESSERCRAGFCSARPIDAGAPPAPDGGRDAGLDAGEIPEPDAGVDAGGSRDAGFDAFVPGDSGPGDAGLPPLVIGPAETVTSFPFTIYEPETSPGACAPVCSDLGKPYPWLVHPFTISAPMQFTSWFRHRLDFDGARQSLREGATCVSTTAHPDMDGRVLPAGTYDAIVCGAPGHSMIVEPVPPPTPHTSCATALPVRFGEVIAQSRDVSVTRLHYRFTVGAGEVWDAVDLFSATMDGARPTLTIRRVCDDPATTLATIEMPHIDAVPGTPWRVGPYPTGVYELIFDVPRGFEFQTYLTEEGW